jgi:hypothetical protein
MSWLLMIVRRVLGPFCEREGKAVGGEEGEGRKIYRNQEVSRANVM